MIISLPDWAINLLAAPALDSGTTPTYAVTVSCTDTWGSSTVDLTVTVLTNAPPQFTPTSTSTTVDESETAKREIYTVPVADADSLAFTCDITTASVPFTCEYDSGFSGNLFASIECVLLGQKWCIIHYRSRSTDRKEAE